MTVVQPIAEPGKSTKEDWLNLAIRALVNDGIDHVKIQVIAKELGVSRSSFYWFFESLQDLHNQLLEHWLKKNTGPIIERAMRPAPSIIRAIINVFTRLRYCTPRGRISFEDKGSPGTQPAGNACGDRRRRPQPRTVSAPPT